MSRKTELIDRLRCFDRVTCNDAADALEAQERELEDLRKDAEAFRAVVEHGIDLTVNKAGLYVVARRAGSREAWSRSIHGGDVLAAARAALEAAVILGQPVQQGAIHEQESP